jgi:hypothetical protein
MKKKVKVGVQDLSVNPCKEAWDEMTKSNIQINKINGGIVLFLDREYKRGDSYCEIYKKDNITKNTLSTCSVFTDMKKTVTSIHLSDETVAKLAVLFKNHAKTCAKK